MAKYRLLFIVLLLYVVGLFSAAYTLQLGGIFLLTLVASIILVINLERIKDINFYLFIVGMVANFVDFLTVPLISLGVPLSIWLLYKSRDKDFEKAWLKVIVASSLWLLGYALSWVMKWLQYDLTIENGNMLSIGFSQSFYRMERNNKIAFYPSVTVAIFDCISKASVCTILVGIIISIIGKFKRIVGTKNHIMGAFLLIAMMPFVWYIALCNHTLLHAFFTYRLSILLMISILCVFYYSFFEND